MAKEIRGKFDVECNFCQSAEDVPNPRELSSEKKNLMVFDDLLLEKQTHVDCFYLAQNYFKLPRQSERTRISYVCFHKT